MNKLFFLYLSLFCLSEAQAGFVTGFGIGATTRYETEEKNLADKELIDFEGGVGLGMDFEFFISKPLSFNIGGNYRSNSTKTQYSYASRSNPLDTATVADLLASASTFAVSFGPRFRFLNFDRFKLFLGAGYAIAGLSLTYDEEDFEEKNAGSDIGYRENDFQRMNGFYYELGAEYIHSNVKAFRVMGRQTSYSTGKFETLANTRLNINHAQIVFQFLQYVNF